MCEREGVGSEGLGAVVAQHEHFLLSKMLSLVVGYKLNSADVNAFLKWKKKD